MPSLNEIIETLPEAPVSGAALAFRAKVRGADPSVVEFFEAIPPGTVFRTKTELIKRARQTTLL